MQSDLQFREGRLYFVGASSSDSLSTQFSNTIIYASGARTHNDKIQFLRESIVLDITIFRSNPYPVSRRKWRRIRPRITLQGLGKPWAIE
jgi:hypothetical protein